MKIKIVNDGLYRSDSSGVFLENGERLEGVSEITWRLAPGMDFAEATLVLKRVPIEAVGEIKEAYRQPIILNDMDRAEAFLRSLSIGYTMTEKGWERGEKCKAIVVRVGADRVVGYEGFVTELHFNTDGRFIRLVVAE